MKRDRREFIWRSGALLISGAAGASFTGLLTGCSESATSPRLGVEICPNTCTGCGECLPSCNTNAIELPKVSSYSIKTEQCLECGDCLIACEQKAISVAVKQITLNESQCVGCGECIEPCRREGGALQWTREHYSVNGNCRPGRCRQQCVGACPQGAIARDGGHARIDHGKCTRCGECVAVCPFGGITPAQVFMDETRCTRCGSCVDACRYGAIEGLLPSSDFEPWIDAELCNRCGVCESTCTHGAIAADKFQATVLAERCTGCGTCVGTCPFDAIRTI
jgi:ferredoxin